MCWGHWIFQRVRPESEKDEKESLLQQDGFGRLVRCSWHDLCPDHTQTSDHPSPRVKLIPLKVKKNGREVDHLLRFIYVHKFLCMYYRVRSLVTKWHWGNKGVFRTSFNPPESSNMSPSLKGLVSSSFGFRTTEITVKSKTRRRIVEHSGTGLQVQDLSIQVRHGVNVWIRFKS